MIYGQLVREAIEEQQEYQAIQEMFFSKKDLQDPETIKKIDNILNKKDAFNNVAAFAAFIEVALYIAITVVTKGIALLGVFPFAKVLLGTLDVITSMPKKKYEKNIKKFEEKVIKLKQESENKLKSDPKNASKYKEIINNCNKVLAEFEKRKKEAARIQKEKDYKAVKSTYEDLIDWLKSPYEFGQELYLMVDIFWLAQILKIPENIITKKLDLLTKKDGDPLFDIDWLGAEEDDMHFDYSTLPESKSKEPIEVMYFDDDIDSVIIYSPSAKKLFEFGSKKVNNRFVLESSSIYDFVDIKVNSDYNSIDFNDKYYKDILVDVDKELGYYRLSDCSPQVEKKPFPV